MEFNLKKARQETPGCKNVLHFNNAGASLMPKPVLDAVTSHLVLEAAMGGYEAAAEAHNQVEFTYDAIAALLNCHREEIAVVENATRAWDMAFYAIDFQPGDRILTAMAEYASNYIAFLQVAQKTGAIIEIIPNDNYGQLSIEALENMIDDRVKLIAITHIPTNGGLVNPAIAVGRIARQTNTLYLLDACQSVGQIPLDVNRIGCDMLSATGRKFLRGPRGTGFLYVRRNRLDILQPPFLDLHAATWITRDTYEIRLDARRFENWETNYAAKIGLGVAVDYALKWGSHAIWERIQNLAKLLRTNLSVIPGVKLQDLGQTQCGIVTFTVENKNTLEICQQLKKHRINVSHSTPFSTRLDMENRQLSGLIRASVHYYNSEIEVNRFCNVLSTLT